MSLITGYLVSNCFLKISAVDGAVDTPYTQLKIDSSRRSVAPKLLSHSVQISIVNIFSMFSLEISSNLI